MPLKERKIAGMSLDRAGAEDLAIRALGHLASDPSAIERFLALSGVPPEGLRQAAAEPEFLGAVLDFLLDHEPLLLTFCQTCGIDPNDVAGARRGLDG